MKQHTGAAFGIDSNGVPIEEVTVDGRTVVIHYDDIPESDITTVNGMACTTAVRTVIDIAADLEPDELETVVEDALSRKLFTVGELTARLSKPDLAMRPGAVRMRAFLAARASRRTSH